MNQFDRDSDPHDAYVYDSIWTLALSLQEMVNNGTNLYEVSQKSIFQDSDYLTEYSEGLYKRMKEQVFHGWTGQVEFRGHERFSDRVQLLEFVDGNLLHRGNFEGIPYNKDSSYTVEEIENINLNIDEDFSYWDREKASDGIKDEFIPEVIISVVVILSAGIVVYITFLIVVIMVGKLKKLQSTQ